MGPLLKRGLLGAEINHNGQQQWQERQRGRAAPDDVQSSGARAGTSGLTFPRQPFSRAQEGPTRQARTSQC